jgi:p-hydroxybenzoic acid efflux pump subunit AaeA
VMIWPSLLMILFSYNVQAQTVQIGSLVVGQVVKVFVKPGQNVRVGQALLNIDDGLYKSKLKKAKSLEESKKLVLADAKISLDQALDLYNRTVTAKRSLDAVQLAYNLAQQNYLQAQAEVEGLMSQQRYYYVKSPIKGTVKSIQAPLGTTVYEENTPLIQVTK